MPEERLKVQAATSVLWAGLSLVGTSLLQLIQLAVLGRLLTPSDFGVMSMAGVVAGFANIFQDMGIGNATIYHQDATHAQLSSMFWWNLLLGLMVSMGFWMITPVASMLYHEPRVTLVMRWLSSVFVLGSIGCYFQALLEKTLAFRRLAQLEIAAASVGVVGAITLAITGYGVLALVGGALISVAAKTVLLTLAGWKSWRPSLHCDVRDLKGYLGYGLYHVGQRTINFITANVDFMLIGSCLGAQPLGYYTLAYNLANLPSTKVNAVIARVFFPVFAKVQHELATLKTGYLQMQQCTSLVNMPILAALAVTAPVAIPLILGSTWTPSVALLQILVLVGWGRSIAGTIGPLILARGRTDLGFRWSLGLIAMQVPALYAGIRSGSAVGVAIAFAILQTVYVLLNYRMLVRTLLGPCLKQYVNSIGPALGMSAVMVVGMWAVSGVAASWPPLVRLMSQLTVGMVLYAMLAWSIHRPFVLSIVELVLRRVAI